MVRSKEKGVWLATPVLTDPNLVLCPLPAEVHNAFSRADSDVDKVNDLAGEIDVVGTGDVRALLAHPKKIFFVACV